MGSAQIASQMPKLEEARVRGCQKEECLGQSARVRQAASRRSFLQRDRLTAWVSSWASSAGEFHPRALSEPDVNLSAHTAPAVAVTPRVVTSCDLASLIGSSHCWLTRRVRLYNITPSLHPFLGDFIATTGDSAPVQRFRTLILVGPPLGFLRSHRCSRFPRSTQPPPDRLRPPQCRMPLRP